MNKLRLLSTSIGLIYLWFGALKLVPSLSPAEALAGNTIELITFDLISGELGRILLAAIEVLIGLGLILSIKREFIVKAALCHMFCTFIPLFAFPEVAFSHAPFGFTMVGQYIMKNVVIIMALFLLLPKKEISIGKVTSEPQV